MYCIVYTYVWGLKLYKDIHIAIHVKQYMNFSIMPNHMVMFRILIWKTLHATHTVTYDASNMAL